MEVVAGDVRNYLRYILDDDFTVNLNSNDKNAKKRSADKSIRASWSVPLPLRLEFRREQYEVGIISMQMKNVQANSPLKFQMDDGIGNIDEGDIPAQRIENRADLFQNLLLIDDRKVDDSRFWLVWDRTKLAILDVKDLLQGQFEFIEDGSSSLGDIWSKLGSILSKTSRVDALYLKHHPISFQRNLERVASRGVDFVEAGSEEIKWATGPFEFMKDDFTLNKGIVMTGDMAHYLRLRDSTEFSKYYSPFTDSGSGYFFGNSVNVNDGKRYYFIGTHNWDDYLHLQPLVLSTRPVLSSVWSSKSPFELRFTGGGDADPTSSKKLTLSVPSGKTLKFLSRDGVSYTFAAGVVFEGLPLALYHLLARSMINQFPFLTPDVGAVNVAIKCLHYPSGPYTTTSRGDNDLLLFNLPLTDALVQYSPPPQSRIYRELENVNNEDLAVDIVDSLNPQRSPQFHVGISDVTLHFREIWNNPFRS